MKVLQRGRNGRQEKPFCLRYFKWLLWFSLSSCFFLSFHVARKPTSFPKTALSLSISSRALFESPNSSSVRQPINHHGVLKHLKVYVYDLPSKYNSDWLKDKRCSNHLFASEVAIHKALLNAGVRTASPYQADFFFVPVYVSCNFSTVNGFPAIGHARGLISSAVRLISSNFPFWNRSRGSDHVFVASHDYGACFHSMEERAVEEGIPKFLKNSIVLQTFGVRYRHPCQEVEHVIIPPYVSPERVRSTLTDTPANGRRDIFTFFRGKMEIHPKNVSGRFYSK